MEGLNTWDATNDKRNVVMKYSGWCKQFKWIHRRKYSVAYLIIFKALVLKKNAFYKCAYKGILLNFQKNCQQTIAGYNSFISTLEILKLSGDLDTFRFKQCMNKYEKFIQNSTKVFYKP